MKSDNKGPKLYSKKGVVLTAVFAALVIAAVVLCIVLIAKGA